jgi:hypothetical protein
MGMDAISKNKFEWINYAVQDVSHWDLGKPTNDKKEACVLTKYEIQKTNRNNIFKTTYHRDGKWSNQNCSDVYFYACEKDTLVTTPAPLVPKPKCPASIQKDLVTFFLQF